MFTRSARLLATQVQWRSPEIVRGGIDQSQLSISDTPEGLAPFSFLVMGDTDAGINRGEPARSFSAEFAKQIMQQVEESRFLLHTGDVTYPMGSYENYLYGFLQPYQMLLNGLPSRPDDIKKGVVFNRPLLPVPGNHDYAGFRTVEGRWRGFLRFVCDRLRTLGVDVGQYGGEGGEAYGRLFLDQLDRLTPAQRTQHLAAHYDAYCEHVSGESSLVLGRCLNYKPGAFTQLPNRYYQFCYGGVDFFALDSNSWNMDPKREGFDGAQLEWLVRSLVASWQSVERLGRVIYLHHSPYTTESSRWKQSETLWVRRHLRTVLDRVVAELASVGVEVGGERRPPVDLVLGGHAHCFEHVRTMQTYHADAQMDWVVCGGSGADVRRQRQAGEEILEQLSRNGRDYTGVVAKSLVYRGVHGRSRRRAHSFLRVDVNPKLVRPFSVTPFLVSWTGRGWKTDKMDSRPVGGVRTVEATAGKELPCFR